MGAGSTSVAPGTAGANGAEDTDPAGPGGGQLPDVPAVCGDPATSVMRRLTNREYQRTLNDLFGAGLPDVAARFPPDQAYGSFDNNAVTQNFTLDHARTYMAGAEEVAAAVFSNATRRAAILPCDVASGDAACLQQFVTQFGRRAYRRPLAADEVNQLVALAQKQPTSDPYAGASAVVEAMLQSTSFLFRPEVGRDLPARPGLRAVSGYEMASRLSYALWGTLPDDALFLAAEAGELETPEGVRSHARRMMQSPRAKDAFHLFMRQWLNTPLLGNATRDTAHYPLWGDPLKASMAGEVERFMAHLAFEPSARFIDFIDSKTTFVDSNLAKLYNVTEPPAGQWAQVTFPSTHERSGVMTLASVLTTASKPEAASPMLRGKFVRDVVLCDPPPPPSEAAVTSAPVKAPGESERDWLARHRDSPACNSCHRLIDPIGFGLEAFGPIGEQRTVNEVGQPVDTRGEVVGFNPSEFVGANGLSQRLRENQDKVGRCVVTQALRFHLGRSEELVDACTIDAIASTFATGGYRYPELIEALVTSDAFRFRRASVDDPPAGGATSTPSTPSTPSPSTPNPVKLTPVSASASSDDGNVAANTIDGNLSTRWAANGEGQYVQVDLGAVKTAAYVRIAWAYGAERSDKYRVALSTDGATFTTVYDGQTAGGSTDFQRQDFTPAAARFVRIVGMGNSQNTWNSISELEVYGQ